jgi:hypothetical protein
MADEILRYRQSLRLLAEAISWTDEGKLFALLPPGPLWRPRRASKDAVVPPAA